MFLQLKGFSSVFGLPVILGVTRQNSLREKEVGRKRGETDTETDRQTDIFELTTTYSKQLILLCNSLKKIQAHYSWMI
jgi:hypothetical protein